MLPCLLIFDSYIYQNERFQESLAKVIEMFNNTVLLFLQFDEVCDIRI